MRFAEFGLVDAGGMLISASRFLKEAADLIRESSLKSIFTVSRNPGMKFLPNPESGIPNLF